MYFRLLHDEASGGVSYLLADLEAGEAVLIDPRGVDVSRAHGDAGRTTAAPALAAAHPRA